MGLLKRKSKDNNKVTFIICASLRYGLEQWKWLFNECLGTSLTVRRQMLSVALIWSIIFTMEIETSPLNENGTVIWERPLFRSLCCLSVYGITKNTIQFREFLMEILKCLLYTEQLLHALKSTYVYAFTYSFIALECSLNIPKYNAIFQTDSQMLIEWTKLERFSMAMEIPSKRKTTESLKVNTQHLILQESFGPFYWGTFHA